MIATLGGWIFDAARRVLGRITRALSLALEDVIAVALLAGAGLLALYLPQLEPVRQWLTDTLAR